MNIEFSDLNELYKRLEPALSTKEAEFRRNDYVDITKKDIWDYLAENKWKISSDLQLYQMVDDILHATNEDIINFLGNR